jgi:multidrug resistance efflux pump
MSYPICCAVPGSGGAAWTTCVDPEPDELELDAALAAADAADADADAADADADAADADAADADADAADADADADADAAAADAMTPNGLTFTGLATWERVPEALSMAISSWRSASSAAMELLCGSDSSAGARPLAPLPFGLTR